MAVSSIYEYTYTTEFNQPYNYAVEFVNEDLTFAHLIKIFSIYSDEELHSLIDESNQTYNMLKNVNKKEEAEIQRLKQNFVKYAHTAETFSLIEGMLRKQNKFIKEIRKEKNLIESQIRLRRRVIFALSNIIKSRRSNVALKKASEELQKAEERYAGKKFEKNENLKDFESLKKEIDDLKKSVDGLRFLVVSQRTWLENNVNCILDELKIRGKPSPSFNPDFWNPKS